MIQEIQILIFQKEKEILGIKVIIYLKLKQKMLNFYIAKILIMVELILKKEMKDTTID